MDDIINRSEEEKDRRAKLTRIQRDMAIIESDLRKARTLREGLDEELRAIKRKKSMLRSQEDELTTKFRKVENEERMLQEDLNRAKKIMNKL